MGGSEYLKRWREKNRERIKAYNLTPHRQRAERNRKFLKNYGITIEVFDQMFAAQGGKCASCGAESALMVDHNHAARVVRELICHACNLCEGHLRTPERAEALAAYMRKWAHLND